MKCRSSDIRYEAVQGSAGGRKKMGEVGPKSQASCMESFLMGKPRVKAEVFRSWQPRGSRPQLLRQSSREERSEDPQGSSLTLKLNVDLCMHMKKLPEARENPF